MYHKCIVYTQTHVCQWLTLAVAAESTLVDASFQEQTHFEASQDNETSTPPAGTLGAHNRPQAHLVPTNNAQQPHGRPDYMYSFGDYGFDAVEFSPRQGAINFHTVQREYGPRVIFSNVHIEGSVGTITACSFVTPDKLDRIVHNV